MARQTPMPPPEDFAPFAAAAEQEEAERIAAKATRAGAGLSWLASIAGLAWVTGVAAAAFASLGAPGLIALPVAHALALGCAALAPALMMALAGSAAREGARARAEARRLADAADRMLNPSPQAEAAARRLGVSVRGEIAALERALERTLAKVAELDEMISSQSRAVDAAAGVARAGAQGLVQGLERERTELVAITDHLKAQSGAIGETIHRHTRLIADAARLAESEVRAADETLESRLTSFSAAAALINDRTGALQAAARSSAESALRLETALSQSLDSLTKASALTDAARQSADAATLAANATAGAVRETTTRAVEDARRAAELIRGEAAQVAREAEATLERLRETAAAARESAQGARIAAGAAPPPAEPARRPAPAARTWMEPPRPEVAPLRPAAPATPEPARPRFERPPSTPLREPPQQDRSSREQPTAPAATPIAARDGARDRGRDGARDGSWTWRDLLAGIDAERAPTSEALPPEGAPARPNLAPIDQSAMPRPPHHAPAGPAPTAPVELRIDPRLSRPAATPSNPFAHRPAPVTPPTRPIGGGPPALALLDGAGVRLEEVFSTAALDRIGHRARNGTQARRRAVKDAAPEAVAKLAAHLAAEGRARADAAGFLRQDGAKVAELLGRGRAVMTADVTRAFLLIDAAAS